MSSDSFKLGTQFLSAALIYFAKQQPLKHKETTMMKNKSHEPENDSKVDMNPMLDVVFILLIFFIVTTTFVKAKGIELSRPQSNSQNNQTSKSVQISIDKDNIIWMDNRQVDAERVAANIASIGANFSIQTIQINADLDSTHQTLVTVMDQVKLIGDYPIALTSQAI